MIGVEPQLHSARGRHEYSLARRGTIDRDHVRDRNSGRDLVVVLVISRELFLQPWASGAVGTADRRSDHLTRMEVTTSSEVHI